MNIVDIPRGTKNRNKRKVKMKITKSKSLKYFRNMY